MPNTNEKLLGRLRRKARIRKKMKPELGLPRLTVYRSNKHLYAQIIDDIAGKTLVAASTATKESASELKGKHNLDAAKKVGAILGKKAVAAKIEKVAFDRNGYRFHGKVKAIADAAREAGLKF